MQHSLKRNMLWNSVGSFGNLLCQWLVTLLVVRLSSTYEPAGYLNLAISVTAIFGTAATFNLRTYIISEDRSEYSSSVYSGFRVFTCLAATLLCLVYALQFGYDVTQLSCVALYMMFRIVDAITDLIYAFEQKESCMEPGGKGMLLRGVVSLLSFALTFVTTQNIVAGIAAMCVASLAVLLFFDVPRVREFGSFAPALDLPKQAELLKSGGIITATSFLSDWVVTYSRQAITMVLGNELMGAYATVAAPVVIVQVGISYVFNPLLPRLHQNYQNNNKELYYKDVARVFLAIVVFTAASLLGAVVLGQPALSLLYGASISSYYYLLPTLVLATALNALQWFLRILLVMQREMVAQFFACAAALAICFAVSPTVISHFGVIGANYVLLGCYSLSTFVTLVAFVAKSRRHFRN